MVSKAPSAPAWISISELLSLVSLLSAEWAGDSLLYNQVDTDPGVDDIVAILLAIASPELEILAFVVSFGNTDIDSSYHNVFKVYQSIARHLEEYPEDTARFPNFKSKCPPLLVRGSPMPLEGELHSAKYFHGRDGLGNIKDRHPELDLEDLFFDTIRKDCLQVVDDDGLDAILRIIRSRPPRTITYVALGPLTNLALLVEKDRDTMTNMIGLFVSMGGALDVPGNTTPVAEFNFFADPFAVKRLLLSGSQSQLPLDRFLMLPLDITTPHEIPFPVYKSTVDTEFATAAQPSVASNKPPLTHFTSSFLERTRDIMLEFGKDAMELHDIVAIWCAICNPPVPEAKEYQEQFLLTAGWKARKRVFDIERTGELCRGMLVVDRRDDVSAYAPGANRAEVQRLMDVLREKDGLWESTALPARVEVEERPVNAEPHGVWCVTDTPGPKALLRLLFKRVWNADLDY